MGLFQWISGLFSQELTDAKTNELLDSLSALGVTTRIDKIMSEKYFDYTQIEYLKDASEWEPSDRELQVLRGLHCLPFDKLDANEISLIKDALVKIFVTGN